MACRDLLVAAVFSALSWCSLTAPEASLNLVLFNSSFSTVKGARCLDGSPGGFYINRGKLDTKWIIFLQGGGLCFTAESCKQRTATPLGSSHYWTNSIGGEALYSSNPVYNPDFYHWSHVYIPYCTGDLWSGTITKATTASFGFYFAGHLNLMASIDLLIATTSLGRATDVILSGTSAGGIGVFNNLDVVAEKLKGGATVVGNPWAGWFFPNVTSYTRWQKHLPSNRTNKPLFLLYQSYVNEACSMDNKGAPWLCGPAAVQQLYPYIKSRLFVAQNMFDSDQLFGHLGCPRQNTSESNSYMLYYGGQALEAMQMVKGAVKNDGFYMPSCLNHDANMFEFTASPAVSGATLSEALAKWYLYGDTVQLVDTCHTVNCNSGCRASGRDKGRSKDQDPYDDAKLLASFRKYFGIKI